jgi:hypothetical protein
VCNVRGAGPHFQHTTELIIEDEHIGLDVGSVHTGLIRLPELHGSGPVEDTLGRDNDFYQFLQIMHHDRLERFWYFGS